MTPGRLWLALLGLLGVLCLGTTARAREIVIRLGDAASPAPSHVCVASLWSKVLSEANKAPQPLSTGLILLDPDGATQLEGDTLRARITPDPSSSTQTALLDAAQPRDAPCGFWKVKGASWAAPAAACAPAPRVSTCQAFAVEKGELPDDRRMSCHRNQQPSATRGHLGVVVFDFAHSKVNDVRLTGHLARIEIDAAKNAGLPEIRVVGGSYLPVSEIPVQELGGAGLVELPLVPRCSEQPIRLPGFECPRDPLAAEASSSSDIVLLRTQTHEMQLPRGALTTEMTLELPNTTSATRELTLLACPGPDGAFAHELRASWRARDLPETRELVPRRLEFLWERHGLVDAGECPCSAELVERGISCALVGAAAEGQPSCTGDASSCRYRCEGDLQLPTLARFSRVPTRGFPAAGTAADPQAWELPLARAGQRLQGFVPRELSLLALRWCGWTNQEGVDLSERWGDEITSVVLESSDGRVFRIRPTTPWIRVPNLQRGDIFTLRFEGSRVYKSLPAEVREGGSVVIPYPGKTLGTMPDEACAEAPDLQLLASRTDGALEADKLLFALVVAGGLRHASGSDERTRWAPYAELDVVATARAWRVRPFGAPGWRDVYFDPEVRAGFLFTTTPYGTGFSSGMFEDSLRQRNVLSALFPVEGSLHFFDNQPFHFGVGGGVVFSRPVHSADSNRLSNPLKGSITATVGIGIARAFAIDADLRVILNNERINNTFTEAGLDRSEVESFAMTTLGVRLRFNDAFEGGRERSTLSTEPDDSPPPTATSPSHEPQEATALQEPP